ncbi:hypothetical protein HYH02_007026 [Chlamydomonas schloesseri]|uniref:PDEase domain-containing protein n=1 Tax=Chlamydomonas schloesseri TaxID=2026947 RepID=A0A836B5H0_9CHLO|nr:hypothetical protein HYH02_007026 [Chlamydomonas schloesseri]|eukprot:KAG2447998.1 hypothetical protein HYH02_007026 [Chlamydomonas schloesseri]
MAQTGAPERQIRPSRARARLKSALELVRDSLAFPFLLFATIVGLGVWIVTLYATSVAEDARADVRVVATEAAAAFRLQLASALEAVEALAAVVQERPQWADVQHSFGQLAKPLAGLAGGPIAALQLLPAGVVRLSYIVPADATPSGQPDTSSTGGTNVDSSGLLVYGTDIFEAEYSIGLETATAPGLLCADLWARAAADGGRAPSVLGPVLAPAAAARSNSSSSADGAAESTAERLLLVRQAVYARAAAGPGETWGRPDGPGPLCGALCTYNATSGTMLWGLVTASVRLDVLVQPLEARLAAAGLRYSLEAVTGQDSQNWSVAEGQQQQVAVAAAAGGRGSEPLPAFDASGGSGSGRRDSVVRVEVPLPGALWQLRVAKAADAPSSSWWPRWYGGAVAGVVLGGAAAAAALFGLLYSRQRHARLLQALLPRQLLRGLQQQDAAAAVGPCAELGPGDGSPAELLSGLLSDLLDGQPPDLREVLLLRALLSRQADWYAPAMDVGKAIRGAGLDNEVARALMHQLGTGAPAAGPYDYVYDSTYAHAAYGASARCTDSASAAAAAAHDADEARYRRAVAAVAAGGAAVATVNEDGLLQRQQASCNDLKGALAFLMAEEDEDIDYVANDVADELLAGFDSARFTSEGLAWARATASGVRPLLLPDGSVLVLDPDRSSTMLERQAMAAAPTSPDMLMARSRGSGATAAVMPATAAAPAAAAAGAGQQRLSAASQGSGHVSGSAAGLIVSSSRSHLRAIRRVGSGSTPLASLAYDSDLGLGNGVTDGEGGEGGGCGGHVTPGGGREQRGTGSILLVPTFSRLTSDLTATVAGAATSAMAAAAGAPQPPSPRPAAGGVVMPAVAAPRNAVLPAPAAARSPAAVQSLGVECLSVAALEPVVRRGRSSSGGIPRASGGVGKLLRLGWRGQRRSGGGQGHRSSSSGSCVQLRSPTTPPMGLAAAPPTAAASGAAAATGRGGGASANAPRIAPLLLEQPQQSATAMSAPQALPPAQRQLLAPLVPLPLPPPPPSSPKLLPSSPQRVSLPQPKSPVFIGSLRSSLVSHTGSAVGSGGISRGAFGNGSVPYHDGGSNGGAFPGNGLAGASSTHGCADRSVEPAPQNLGGDAAIAAAIAAANSPSDNTASDKSISARVCVTAAAGAMLGPDADTDGEELRNADAVGGEPHADGDLGTAGAAAAGGARLVEVSSSLLLSESQHAVPVSPPRLYSCGSSPQYSQRGPQSLPAARPPPQGPSSAKQHEQLQQQQQSLLLHTSRPPLPHVTRSQPQRYLRSSCPQLPAAAAATAAAQAVGATAASTTTTTAWLPAASDISALRAQLVQTQRLQHDLTQLLQLLQQQHPQVLLSATSFAAADAQLPRQSLRGLSPPAPQVQAYSLSACLAPGKVGSLARPPPPRATDAGAYGGGRSTSSSRYWSNYWQCQSSSRYSESSAAAPAPSSHQLQQWPSSSVSLMSPQDYSVRGGAPSGSLPIDAATSSPRLPPAAAGSNYSPQRQRQPPPARSSNSWAHVPPARTSPVVLPLRLSPTGRGPLTQTPRLSSPSAAVRRETTPPFLPARVLQASLPTPLEDHSLRLPQEQPADNAAAAAAEVAAIEAATTAATATADGLADAAAVAATTALEAPAVGPGTHAGAPADLGHANATGAYIGTSSTAAQVGGPSLHWGVDAQGLAATGVSGGSRAATLSQPQVSTSAVAAGVATAAAAAESAGVIENDLLDRALMVAAEAAMAEASASAGATAPKEHQDQQHVDLQPPGNIHVLSSLRTSLPQTGTTPLVSVAPVVAAAARRHLLVNTSSAPPPPPPPPAMLDHVERLLAAVDSFDPPPLTGSGSRSAAFCWQYDTWALAEATGGRPLACMGFFLLQRSGLVAHFGIDPRVLCRLLRAVEAGYLPNPYHSATHAADVVRSLHALLRGSGMMAGVAWSAAAAATTDGGGTDGGGGGGGGGGTGSSGYLDPLGLLAAYWAAIVHDLGHPGLTGDFLVATGHPLAIRYNDRSPLESHHASASFTLLAERPELDAFAVLSREQRAAFRKQVIDLVLATDMKQHFAILTAFNTTHRLGASAAAAAAGAGGSKGIHSGTGSPDGAAGDKGASGGVNAGSGRGDSDVGGGDGMGGMRPHSRPHSRTHSHTHPYMHLLSSHQPHAQSGTAPLVSPAAPAGGGVGSGRLQKQSGDAAAAAAAAAVAAAGGSNPSGGMLGRGAMLRRSSTSGMSVNSNGSGGAGAPGLSARLFGKIMAAAASVIGAGSVPSGGGGGVAAAGRASIDDAASGGRGANAALRSSSEEPAADDHVTITVSDVMAPAADPDSAAGGGVAAEGQSLLPAAAAASAQQQPYAVAAAAADPTLASSSGRAGAAPATHGAMAVGQEITSVSGEIGGVVGVNGDGARRTVTPRGMAAAAPPPPQDEAERLLSLQVLLKAADVGHLGASLEVHKRWLEGLEEEFFRQGDRERALGLPISPLFDRSKQGVSKSQVGFYDFVALPLVRALTSAFPGAHPWLECFEANRAHWLAVQEQQQLQAVQQQQQQQQAAAQAAQPNAE